MLTNAKTESDRSEQRPTQVPMYPKLNGRVILNDDEVRAAVERGRALRAEFTKNAVIAAYKALAGIPERVGNWLKYGHGGAHSTH